jgi:threonine/homoserine/homoserine lactone efflux protein
MLLTGDDDIAGIEPEGEPALLAFALVATLAILSPGPAVLLSLRNGATLGARSVMWSALGNISGVCCLSIAAILGLGVVLKSSMVLFGVLKIAGAAYLFYVGVRQWRASSAVRPVMEEGSAPARRRRRDLYREGFLVAATNPKAVLFFTALFPQFIDAQQPVFAQFVLLTVVFMAISYAAHLIYANVASRARAALLKPLWTKWMSRFSGVMFMVFGALLLALRRPAS